MTYKTNKITSSKITRVTLFSALMLILLVPISGLNVNAVVDTSISTDALTANPSVPLAPTNTGCYNYTEKTGWTSQRCFTPEEMKNFVRPTVGGASGVHGIKDASAATQSYGLTDVQFSVYHGETDSKKGTHAWSIQDNTNYWSLGGHTYAVQFTLQTDPTGGQGVCVWQNKVDTPQSYVPTCAPVPAQTLSASYHGSVEGKALSNGNLQSQYCNIGLTTQCWVVVSSDTNQLHTNWKSNSGTILGYGASSAANFVSTTSAVTKVTTGPATSASTFLDTNTLETNNMSYTTSSASCAFSLCTRTSTSTN
ncbi:MAG: hypothetical protein QXN55_05630 [Candidatus Nitrosotenuis sp.]